MVLRRRIVESLADLVERGERGVHAVQDLLGALADLKIVLLDLLMNDPEAEEHEE